MRDILPIAKAAGLLAGAIIEAVIKFQWEKWRESA